MPPISDVKLLDCMEGMAAYPDKFFNLALVDPPYGIGQGALKVRSRSFKKDGTPIVKFDKRSGSQILVKDRQYGHGYFDNEAPGVEYFEELRRVSKNQIIWGANHFISKIPFDSSCWIVWNKINGETDQADSELAWTSFKSAVRNFDFMWNGFTQGSFKNGRVNQGNKSLCETRIHANQKPVALYEWLLRNYAKPGDKILDTHLGSQSSRIAAYKMGFDFYGFEIDKEYFDAGDKRFRASIAMPLFDSVQNVAEQAKLF